MSVTIVRVRGVLYVVLHPRRLLTLLATLTGFALYVWVAAVRAVPGVRARKAAARRRWRERNRGPAAGG
ncbi:MAG TPA: hypothetical protein VFW15_04960 [Thermoanaerobaculia bacterium]|jgi:hypothetical protein|nr:hypothetical protein [Thermoanaerobaculia bacterium]